MRLAGGQPEPLGFSKFAHVGNATDISIVGILDYYGQDEKTTTIAIYVEGFTRKPSMMFPLELRLLRGEMSLI